MPGIVLFLGAGFSAGLQLPVMAEFSAKARRSQPGLAVHAASPEDSPRFRHAAALLIDARRTYESFQRFCAASGLLTESDRGNLEAVFSVAEALNQAGVEQIRLEGRPYAVSSILRDIQTWIWKTYQQLPSDTLRRPDQAHIDTTPYRRLIAALANLRIAHNVDVITTNYDLVFEYFARSGQVPAHYPFPWPTGFGAGSTGEALVMSSENPGLGPCVYKLHGSVNYFENRESPEDIVYVASDLGADEPIGNSNADGTFATEPAILAVDAIWAIRKRYGEGFTPAIVPPTYAKLRSRTWLTRTWRSALEGLTLARCIVFIGYSLPCSDGFMSALLAGAAALRPRGAPLEVYVIDHSPQTHERYRKVFGTLLKGWDPCYFADAVDSLLIQLIARVSEEANLSLTPRHHAAEPDAR